MYSPSRVRVLGFKLQVGQPCISNPREPIARLIWDFAGRERSTTILKMAYLVRMNIF